MATLELRRLNKTHDDGSCAVDDLDLRVADGELFVLVGPSGCGKTTVLRAVAGLETVTHGDVLIGDATVTHQTPQTRDIAMVFQSNVLYPYMTVRENIGFSLRLAKVRKSVVRRKVDDVASMLHLSDVLDRHPGQLSGGQQQRAAIGRAIIREPQLLLMDEPLSSLDAHLRTELRSHIVALQHRLGVTTLYVTHDQVEAMAMGDRAAVMRDGQIVQVGTPLELYQRPVDLFVAQFLGTPTMNVVCAVVVRHTGGVALRLASQIIELDEIALARLPGVVELIGRRVALGVRAEAITHDPKGPLVVSATGVEQHGPDRVVHATIGAAGVRQTASGIVVDEEPISTVAITVDTNDHDIDIFRPFRVSVDTTRIHLFDLTTGRALARR
jgi:multiple sugar transport system ATP-binding protein